MEGEDKRDGIGDDEDDVDLSSMPEDVQRQVKKLTRLEIRRLQKKAEEGEASKGPRPWWKSILSDEDEVSAENPE